MYKEGKKMYKDYKDKKKKEKGANMELSPKLHEYLTLLSMEGYKPVTSTQYEKFANNVVSQIREDYSENLWSAAELFVTTADNESLRPYFLKYRDTLQN